MFKRSLRQYGIDGAAAEVGDRNWPGTQVVFGFPVDRQCFKDCGEQIAGLRFAVDHGVTVFVGLAINGATLDSQPLNEQLQALAK